MAKRVSECVACAHKNDTLWKAGLPKLKPIGVTPKVFWRIHVDVAGPWTQTLNGNEYVALGVCAFTKYVEAAGKIQNTISKVAIYACDLNLLKQGAPVIPKILKEFLKEILVRNSLRIFDQN